MDQTVITELLKKHFGEPRDSLTIGGKENAACTGTDRPRTLYFYSLEKEDEITAICDLLSERFYGSGIKMPELAQTFRKKNRRDADRDATEQCARFTERDGGWDLDIFEIAGVTYHRTYGGGTAATLRLRTTPFVSLTDRSPAFYGYWDTAWFSRVNMPVTAREGLSYWVNKALRTSVRFRGFSVDFFFAAAEGEHHHILKDAAQTIERCGCFLPSITYEKLIKCGTPAEVIESFQTALTPLPVDFNKVDLNTGYVMQMLAADVEPRDIPKLAQLDAQDVADAVTLPLFYGPFQTKEFLSGYYGKAFEKLGLPRSMADDYVRLCDVTGAKFRIGCGKAEYIRAYGALSGKERERGEILKF